jgi:hypothetical protein
VEELLGGPELPHRERRCPERVDGAEPSDPGQRELLHGLVACDSDSVADLVALSVGRACVDDHLVRRARVAPRFERERVEAGVARAGIHAEAEARRALRVDRLAVLADEDRKSVV